MVSKKAKAKRAGKAKAPPPPPEKKSNRQRIRDMIDAEGDDAARKLGKELGMAKGTVDAYIKGWARIKSGGALPPKKGEAPPAPVKKREAGKDDIWYRFPNEARAQAWVKDAPKRSGIKPEAFRIVPGPGGMFGVTVDGKYIREHGALTKNHLRMLKQEGGRVENGMIIMPIKKKAT